MPFVLDGRARPGRDRGARLSHVIDFGVDRIRQQPTVDHHVGTEPDARTAPGSRSSGPIQLAQSWPTRRTSFYKSPIDYTWLNPHLTLTVDWFGERSTESRRPIRHGQSGSRRIRPRPHWYTAERSRAADRRLHRPRRRSRARCARSASWWPSSAGLQRHRQAEGGARRDRPGASAVAALSTATTSITARSPACSRAMKAQLAAGQAAALGIIGRAHFQAPLRGRRLRDGELQLSAGRWTSRDDGFPGSSRPPSAGAQSAETRRLVTGVNWSPGILNPFRAARPLRPEPRHDPESAAGRSRRAGDPRAAHGLPARRIHRPRQVGGGGAVMKAKLIIGAVQGVTKKWAKQRKREERDAAARMNRRDALTRRRSVSIRDAAFDAMERAYLKASANGTLPAHARQIMYAARPTSSSALTGNSASGSTSISRSSCCPTTSRHGRQSMECRLRRSRQFHRAAHRRKCRSGPCRFADYLAGVRQHEIRDPEFDVWEAGYPDDRARAPLRRDLVHREGRLLAAVRSGASRRAV